MPATTLLRSAGADPYQPIGFCSETPDIGFQIKDQSVVVSLPRAESRPQVHPLYIP